MNELMDSMTLPDMAGYDREYGRHSNIPECCIEFFATKFLRIFQDPKLFNAHERLQNATERRIKKEFQYRPCLDCMRRGNWRPLHKCDGLPCEGLREELKVKYHLGGYRRG